MSSSDADRTGTLLLRSGIEIGETLEAVRAEGGQLAARPHEDELPFLTRLLLVDRRGGRIVVSLSELKSANSALLSHPAVTFGCNHGGAHYEFAAARPQQIEFEGAAAIQLDFPPALLRTQRREHPRYTVPPRVPLRCVVEWGPVSFEAQVVDISRSGMGSIVVDPGVHLEPGTHLPRAWISHPERAVAVALEVRHVRKVTLADARPALRAGCRFVGAPRDIEDLIALFVTDLDA